MANVYVEYGIAFSPAIAQGLHVAAPGASEVLAISGANAVSQAAPTSFGINGGNYTIARVTAAADVWLSSGLTPDAGVAPRRVLLAGASIDLIIPAGHKIAVKALD
ncbi:hypothetical protein [Chelatococcus sp.]|uniref:hypothetical protein n=1 Tax=Chelatococcus sp. TaxID=1953771 RepID=UPI001ED09244|nr:hypothetical protein [Chelatococcus sp.]MBX3543569.1 hypothetical protein [Chelatococcus sp.]